EIHAQSGRTDDGVDLIFTNGRVYSLNWDEPALDGTPANNAPYRGGQWRHDAEAVAIRGGEIVRVGSNQDVMAMRTEGRTRVVDVHGACILPGFVDAHTHVANLGAVMTQLDLRGVETPEEAIELAVAWSKDVPDGKWIVGHGWDEGDWATDGYPDWSELSRRLPNHPVALDGLHGFATWGNKLAFEKAGIDVDTRSPVGGEISKNEDGQLTGILLNNASKMLAAARPAPTPEERIRDVAAGAAELNRSGYVAVHEAGVYSGACEAWEHLAENKQLSIRFYGMIAATDPKMVATALARGPFQTEDSMLFLRGVKAYYDGSLGARGARLLGDYSDMHGHRGVSGDGYGFDQSVVTTLIRRGFQVGIHAIGDAGNRETIDYLESVFQQYPKGREARHRIEHAQILHVDDIPRLKELDLVASMQPPHAVEDMTWARYRLGRDRLMGAYAWRTLRETGAALAFGSDLHGSDHSIFYGLHAALTRRNKQQQPVGGWFPEQCMTIEESIRGYTSWPAYASHLENKTGVLAPGRWADVTVIDLDPFELAATDPGKILDGNVLLTVVNGQVVFEAKADGE
ncbi:MAG: amidohydrolase, partial [Pirellulales bacterium]|nr:amidohydrolase [Pirellulales bacterium]